MKKFRVPIKCNICNVKAFQYWEWNGQQFIECGYGKCKCIKSAFEIVGDVEQSIGLHDSKGVEIFEGDIVRASGDDYHSNESIILDGDWIFVGKVTFDNFIYAVESDDKCWITFAEIYSESLKIEIIGNIHEVKNENKARKAKKEGK